MQVIAEKIEIYYDPLKSAEVAELIYISDVVPGIKRIKSGKGFKYVGIDGKSITDKKEIERFKSLIIPPAWKNVWICADPNGHLQATGRDEKGRKQYRYHFRWQKIRNELKFDKMLSFGQCLPRIRKKIQEDLNLKGFPKEKVLATVISIMSETLIRVGNIEYAEENETFGLSTMQNQHVEVKANRIKFKFKGKSGKFHEIDYNNPKLSRLVKKCQELPGHQLFEYLDDAGNVNNISSGDINTYMCSITDQTFTAKDFRTWGGSVYAMQVLQDFTNFENVTEAKKNLTEAIKIISKKLGNTTSVCKKYYIHPKVLESFLDGTLDKIILKSKNKTLEGLKPEELAFINLLNTK